MRRKNEEVEGGIPGAAAVDMEWLFLSLSRMQWTRAYEKVLPALVGVVQ